MASNPNTAIALVLGGIGVADIVAARLLANRLPPRVGRALTVTGLVMIVGAILGWFGFLKIASGPAGL